MDQEVAPLPRVISGMRPTGALHIGHYHGALVNWLRLQDTHDCFFFVADLHALTTPQPGPLEPHVYEMVVDWLAAGVDPERTTLFIQSRLPEHAEAFTLLAMDTPLAWLERVPGWRERAADADARNYGFLGYPLLQAADILIHKGGLVPVGEDQQAHLEFTREVARRFNHRHGRVFPEPQALLSPAARVPGLDGRKMSKSLGNAIAMRETPERTAALIRAMPTDPQRVRRADAGEPARCPVWPLHEIHTDATTRAALAAGCRTAGIGCLDCKQPLVEAVQRLQAPWRERGAELAADPKKVHWILELGVERARAVARKTLKEMRAAMGLSY